jgi:hypothetical protein
MQTLKHIVMNVYGISDDDNGDPLIGIPSDLEDMRANNIIETIAIGTIIEMDVSGRRRDDWGRLDEVLTSLGWFSLKRVSMAIKFVTYGRSYGKVVMELRKLLETQFRRLSSSNSVSFDFEVIPIRYP